LVDVAAAGLRDEILSNGLKPGARIHLDDAANRLSMSAIPIREALRMLASEGLVEPIAQRGYRVRATSVADLKDTYRLRKLIDSWAVRLAVPNLVETDLAALEEAFARLTAASKTQDWPAFRQHHRDFHFGIYNASGSPWILRCLNMLWDNSVRYQRISMSRTAESRAREHGLILAACREGNSEAAAAEMRDHIRLTYLVAKAELELQESERNAVDGIQAHQG
jgi:DNA-binding GntR family transcriptional regulator